MAVEVWWRNPYNWIREVAEVGHPKVMFHRGILAKKRIDPIAFCQTKLGPVDWSCMAVGDQGASVYRPGDTINTPSAVYPVWQYGQELTTLKDLLQVNPGDIKAITSGSHIPPYCRPVAGQDHVIVLVGFPSLRSGPGKDILWKIEDLASDYPEVKLHLSSVYAMTEQFGGIWASTDVDARTPAAGGSVMLANGYRVREPDEMARWRMWLNLVGFSVKDMEVARNRCMAGMKASLWAAEHYHSNMRFTANKKNVDFMSPDDLVTHKETRKHVRGNVKKQEGDEFLCDTCSLMTTCKYYRRKAVCAVPGSEPAELASFFNTRDSDKIIKGLGTLLAIHSKRIEEARDMEQEQGIVDKDVTGLINSLFDRGVKLAKLVDPTLNKPTTQIGVMVGMGGQQASASTRSITATVVAELESRGVPRDAITAEMVAGLSGITDEDSRRTAITAAVEANRPIDGEAR